MKKNKILYALLFTLAACSSNPKEESIEEKQDGDTYTVSGTVFCGEGITKKPANKARVDVKKDTQVLGTYTTTENGVYSISTPMDSDSIYLLSSYGSCGSAKYELKADGKDFTGINLYLER
jgi:hypothetical protein